MSVNFMESETKVNLMRAFAGESMARNRYVFSADFSKKEHFHVPGAALPLHSRPGTAARQNFL